MNNQDVRKQLNAPDLSNVDKNVLQYIETLENNTIALAKLRETLYKKINELSEENMKLKGY